MTLLDEALRVRENAYAPYSNFKVGAALRTKSGAVFVGCNEAGAIAAMCAAGERDLAEIWVLADSPHPTTPCGGCRQKIAEFADADTVIVMRTIDGIELRMNISDLLPGAFEKSHMDNV